MISDKNFMDNNVTIVDATLDKLEEIIQIEEECFTVPWSRSNFESAFDADNTRIFALISQDGTMCGFACLLIIDYEAEILNIAVRQNHRNKGYGKLLMKHMLDLCDSSSISSVYLEVRESNLSARRLYTQNGFEIIGLRKRYYTSPVEDAILMLKKI